MILKYIPQNVNSEDMALVLNYYQQLKDSPMKRWAFYDMSAETLDGFLSIVKQSAFFLIVDPEDKRWIGHVYLNQFQGKTAWIHFGLFSGKDKKVGPKVVEELFRMYELSAMIGSTPANNKAALRYSRYMDFTPVATVPDLIYDKFDGAYHDALITMRTK